MIMSYSERKEAICDDFEEFHNNIGYPLNQTLYATLGETEYSKEYTQTDECCIYLNFALILLKRNESIDFMRERLLKLIEEDNMDKYKSELLNEFIDFENDLFTFKQLIKEIII